MPHTISMRVAVLLVLHPMSHTISMRVARVAPMPHTHSMRVAVTAKNSPVHKLGTPLCTQVNKPFPRLDSPSVDVVTKADNAHSITSSVSKLCT